MKAGLVESSEQLLKGKHIIDQVFAPLSNIFPNWTLVKIIFRPNIENRDTLKKYLLDNEIFKFYFILTVRDMPNSKWFEKLDLGGNEAPDTEYKKKLLSMLIGSFFFKFQC